MYAASRNLYSLAITGNAPKIFAKCSKRGIPIYAVCAVFICSLLSFMVVSENSAKVFEWFMNVTTLSSLFWLTLFLATIRFRKGYLAQGIKTEDLPFHSIFMPYAAYYGASLVAFFILISGFNVFFDFNVKDFFASVGTLRLL
jgi:amino acid transporter